MNRSDPMRKSQNKEVRALKKYFARAKKRLTSRAGEGYVNTAVKMIIAVVIGGLLLAGLYTMFNGVLLPGLAERIQTMFG